MANLSQLRKEIRELKIITNKDDVGSGFDILDKYINKEIEPEEALALLQAHNYSWGDVCILIIESGMKNDEEKKKREFY